MPTRGQLLRKLKFHSKPYGRQWKWRYQNNGYFLEKELQVPKKLEGKPIIDPLHPETVPQPPKEKWIPPARHPILESFFPKPSIKDHPNYNSRPIKLFDRTVKFHAGIDQACLLTKTMPVKSLPLQIANSIRDIDTKGNNELVKSYIRQALAFNTTKERCVNPKLPHDPKFNIRAEYGTPHKRQMFILMSNLIRLSNTYIYSKHLNAVAGRKVLEDSPTKAHFLRGDDWIEVRRISDFALYSASRLQPFADAKAVQETLDYKFVDMYPIFPTVDLKEENVYNLDEVPTVGWRHDLPSPTFPNLHTVFHINDDELSTEVDTARLIMFAFGSAFAQSKIQKTEVNANLELKKPIVVNAVSLTNQRFNFVSYQLNTLNFSDNSGVKNIVHYDVDNEIYLNRPTVHKMPYPSQKNIQRLAMRYLEYNSSAFLKLMSLIAYGVEADASVDPKALLGQLQVPAAVKAPVEN